jgi:hypothetical protein
MAHILCWGKTSGEADADLAKLRNISSFSPSPSRQPGFPPVRPFPLIHGTLRGGNDIV